MIIVLRWDVVCAKTSSLRAVATIALGRYGKTIEHQNLSAIILGAKD
jgi:hypothetical protein